MKRKTIIKYFRGHDLRVHVYMDKISPLRRKYLIDGLIVTTVPKDPRYRISMTKELIHTNHGVKAKIEVPTGQSRVFKDYDLANAHFNTI